MAETHHPTADPGATDVAAQPTAETATAALDLDSALEKARVALEASRTDPGAASTDQADDAPDDAADDDDQTNGAKAAQTTPETADPASGDVTEGADATDQAEGQKLSRRQRAELDRQRQIDEAVEAKLAEKARADQAEQRLAASSAEQQRLLAELTAELGRPEEYDALRKQYAELVPKGLAGDYDASEEAQKVKAKLDGMDTARSRYVTARQVSEQQAQANLEGQYRAAAELPGVELGTLTSVPSLADGLKHIYSAGKAQAEADWKARYERMEADYQAKLARALGKRPTPEAGAGSAAGRTRLGGLEGLIDPATGLPTDEASNAWERGRLKGVLFPS